MSWEVREGDCVEVMAQMEPESVDAVVCDPPYDLAFMGKDWDVLDAGFHTRWLSHAHLVLKPGGVLKAMSGTRTFHRLCAAIEEAGFEIIGMETWSYGSGFPKSLDVGKSLDKSGKKKGSALWEFCKYVECARLNAGLSHKDIDEALGLRSGGDSALRWTTHPTQCRFPKYEHYLGLKKMLRLDDRFDSVFEEYQREVVGVRRDGFKSGVGISYGQEGGWTSREVLMTAAASEEAKRWNGWGTALKPAWEPVVIARKGSDEPLASPRAIHVLRKPLSEGTVAANVLKWGTGGINVDDCRIHSGPSDGGNSSGGNAFGQDAGWNKTDVYVQGIDRSLPKGRWPANLILMHSPGCQHIGTKQVKGSQLNQVIQRSKSKSNSIGEQTDSYASGYTDSEGNETVQDWNCEPGCPVAALDEQSGILTSESRINKIGEPGQYTNWNKAPARTEESSFPSTEGGASRFFKQVQSWDDLISYLETLYTPPDGYESDGCGQVLQDGSEDALEALYGSLNPGAHLFLIAPESQPTGHTLACYAEDIGFEVRDCIAVFEPGSGDAIHYVPKASRSEREEGLDHLESEKGIYNVHPTVKPISLMEQLLTESGTVVDPFLGSGTTGCAAAKNPEINFIGIEKEAEYAEIARNRIHWHSQHEKPPWARTRYSESTAEVEKTEMEKLLEDIW